MNRYKIEIGHKLPASSRLTARRNDWDQALTLRENMPRRSAREHHICIVSFATASRRSGASAYAVRMLCSLLYKA